MYSKEEIEGFKKLPVFDKEGRVIVREGEGITFIELPSVHDEGERILSTSANHLIISDTGILVYHVDMMIDTTYVIHNDLTNKDDEHVVKNRDFRSSIAPINCVEVINLSHTGEPTGARAPWHLEVRYFMNIPFNTLEEAELVRLQIIEVWRKHRNADK